MAKKKSRPRRSKEQWAAILEQFKTSGLNSREFCQREGLAMSSLQRWRRIITNGSTAPAEFVELVPTVTSTPASSSWSLDVSLPNGVSLRFQG